MIQVIDTFVYYGPNPIKKTDHTVDMIRDRYEELKKEGIEMRCIVMPTGPQINDRLIDVYSALPGIVLGTLPQINPNPKFTKYYSYTPAEEIRRLADQEHVVGFKHNTPWNQVPIDSTLLGEIVGVLEQYGLPLTLHCSREIGKSDWDGYERCKTFLDFFRGVLNCAHAGGLSEEKIESMQKLGKEYGDRVFYNSAGLSGEDSRYDSQDGTEMPRSMNPEEFIDITEKLVKSIPDQFVFGSDWPELQNWTLEPFKQLLDERRITQGEFEKVMWKNAMKLFPRINR